MTSPAAVPPPRWRGVGLTGLVFLGAGALLLVAALWLAAYRLAWLSHARHADATVTGIERQMSALMGDARPHRMGITDDGEGLPVPLYRPVLGFTAEDGRRVRVMGAFWSSDTPYRVGEVVRVDYPPGRPEAAVMQDPGQRWFVAGVLALLGAIFGGVGALLTLMAHARAAATRWASAAPRPN